jgi:hypothetical protein
VVVISGPIIAQVAGKKCDCINLPVRVLLAIRADYSRRKGSYPWHLEKQENPQTPLSAIWDLPLEGTTTAIPKDPSISLHILSSFMVD